jgi:hypothetical protein
VVVVIVVVVLLIRFGSKRPMWWKYLSHSTDQQQKELSDLGGGFTAQNARSNVSYVRLDEENHNSMYNKD